MELLVMLLVLGLVTLVVSEDVAKGMVVEPSNSVNTVDNSANSDLVLAFVIFRHGDRTPDQEELDLYPTEVKSKNIFFPYGMKALTNKGKQRAFLVGDYLRSRYDGFISRLYLQDEIRIRTTDYSRTKMTALTALAAMYPPMPAQKWNPALDWQPIPYDTLPYHEDDLLYWYNCPRYIWVRNQAYKYPEVQTKLKEEQDLFEDMSKHTGTNVTLPEDVFYLDNLFQTTENVGVPTPNWAVELMPRIKEMTKIEYEVEFYTPELIKLSSGVLMAEIINATSSAIKGNLEQPKLRLYSAHENNVAALMAASKVFQPHQPNYGATFSLELRRDHNSGRYGIMAVYSPVAGGPGNILQIDGCGNQTLCDYETFVRLTQDYVWSYDEFVKQCPKLS